MRREAEQEVDEIEVGYIDEKRKVLLVGNSAFYDFWDEEKIGELNEIGTFEINGNFHKYLEKAR